jgi:hypothetical protein
VRPSTPDPTEVADRATGYVGTNPVWVSQVRSYLKLFDDDPTFLRDLWAQFGNDRDEMESAALGERVRWSREERAAMKRRYRHLPNAHQYFRGIIATALVLDDRRPG